MPSEPVDPQVAQVRKAIGARIRTLRGGSSQAEVAARAGIDRSFYISVEAGRRNVSVDKLVTIARALGVAIEDLFGGTTMSEDQARTTVVPWETVTDNKGRRAWTAGQIRTAIAHLDDDAPVLVHVATDEDGVTDDQIIIDAGHGSVDWGDGYGLEPDPLFALECEWPTTQPLILRPARPQPSME